jgi:trk system potassium uptake protein TrkH
MHWKIVSKVTGLLLMLFSGAMLPPIVVSVIFGDGTWPAFLISLFTALIGGALMWHPFRKVTSDLRIKDGFIVTTAMWTILPLFGSVPLMLVSFPDIGFTDALFESMSGLTTTGATVLTGLDAMPPALLWYRQQLQWMGGMGIILLAVAILPMLGIGGMQLYRAEAPGPVKDNKLTPRITGTARALWYVYVTLTVTCFLAYWAAGMSAFDAICHSFSTVATGGFSTHDASIGYFDSPLIELIAVVFMFIGGINFSLHFLAWRAPSLKHYLQDAEFRAYLTFYSAVTVLVVVYLMLAGVYEAVDRAFIKGLFQVVSMGTSTGYTSASFADWPGALPVMLILLGFVGGCAGSTAAGMKVVRWLLVLRQGDRELRRLVHPSAIMPVKLGSRAVPDRVIEAVWGFFSVYIIVFTIMMLVMLASGLDQITAFSATAATLNVLGPALGDAAAGFGDINLIARWTGIFGMLVGRLEVFTVLVLLTPAFWRR